MGDLWSVATEEALPKEPFFSFFGSKNLLIIELIYLLEVKNCLFLSLFWL